MRLGAQDLRRVDADLELCRFPFVQKGCFRHAEVRYSIINEEQKSNHALAQSRLAEYVARTLFCLGESSNVHVIRVPGS